MSGPGEELTPASIETIPNPQVAGGVLKADPTDSDLAAFLRRAEWDMAREKVAGLIQDRGERKTYAGRIFYLICGWLILVGLVILLSGFSESAPVLKIGINGIVLVDFQWGSSFKLSDPVLLAIVGSTTATVLGLFAIVANYLFPKAKD